MAFVALGLLASGCGSSQPVAQPAPKPTVDSESSKQKSAPSEPVEAKKEMPTTCTPDAAGLCVPPEDFVKRLCGGSYPDVALSMFGKGTPWTRGYLRRTMDAWSASGGASSNEKVVYDEEVLLVLHRGPDTGGMQVSGASGGSYEAFRWNGTCVSLSAEEVTTRLPPKAKHPRIPWKSLELKTREALEADEKVGAMVAEQRKECKGSTFGEPSPKCAKADEKLSGVIVNYIRNGGAVPTPESLP
ncbi:MAG TPA: hypothetical protein VE093_41760 [Polyangiaceae bacterium]|nr:hypothetical protein [Polyangiaceae bacterium]